MWSMAIALLTEIHEFLAETGMGPSYFGKVAVGNSELVKRLEAGRDVKTETAERVRRFMLTRRAGTPSKAGQTRGH